MRFAATDRVGNAERERTLTVKVDTVAPTVTLTPPARTEFPRGEVVTVAHACADRGSGVVACTGPASLDTAAAGPHELAVTARDAAGNTRTERWAYTVLGTAPKPTVRGKLVKGGVRVTLTSRLRSAVRITGTLKAGKRKVRLRAVRVSLEPGVKRTVTLRPARRLRGTRKADVRLASTVGALRRTDRLLVR